MTTIEYKKITDEMVERLRNRVGRTSRPLNPWNEVATRDAIKHWAWGIGDDNPIFLNRDYAAQTTHGRLIAPPTILSTFSTGPLGPGSGPSKGTGLPGIHALYAGEQWEFSEVVREGDEIYAESTLEDPIEKRSSYTGRMIQQNRITRYYRADGREIGKLTGILMSTERGTPKEYGKWDEIKEWRYSEEDLEMIARQYESEKPRGGELLDWQDIRVGTEIPVRLKGPLTSTSMATFLMGWGSPFCMTDRIAHEYMRLHPGAKVWDGPHNFPDFPERAHWDEWLWKEIGFPTGYDIGAQRIAWFGHLLTDWIGDNGRVKKLTVLLREPNWLFDITWLHGKVIGKEVIDGEPTVHLELWAESQRPRRHATGEATVVMGNLKNFG